MVKIKQKHVINTGIIIILFGFCIGPMITSFLKISTNDSSELDSSLQVSAVYTDYLGIDNGNNQTINIGYLYSGNYFYYEYDTYPTANLNMYLLDSSNNVVATLETNEDQVWYDSHTVSKSDTFKIVFENTDIDTDLDYTITTYVSTPYNPFGIFGPFFAFMSIGIIIAVVVAIIIVAVIVVAIRRNTSSNSVNKNIYRSRASQTQRTPTPSTPVYQQPAQLTTSKPEQTKASIGYCRYCGGKTEVDASFCPQCGSKL